MKNLKISHDDRYKISNLLDFGYSIRHIAKEIGKSPSSISREIKKYSVKGKYDVHYAISQSEANKRKEKKIDYAKYEQFKQEFLKLFKKETCGVKATIATIKQQYPNIETLSPTQVYRLIKKGQWVIGTDKLLKQKYIKGGKIREKKSPRIKGNGVYNINQRSHIINVKQRLGDYEVDLINGTLGSSKGHLFVMLDRKTSKIWIRFIKNKNPRIVVSIIQNLVDTEKLKIYSITCDNGLEFKMLPSLRKYYDNLEIYYCNPYASRERGMIENANGIIRRFFPKGTNFFNVNAKDFIKVEQEINNMRREKFAWKSANEYFNEITNKSNEKQR